MSHSYHNGVCVCVCVCVVGIRSSWWVCAGRQVFLQVMSVFIGIFFCKTSWKLIITHTHVHTHTLSFGSLRRRSHFSLPLLPMTFPAWLLSSCLVLSYTWEQARAQTFWGAGAQTKKKGTQCQKKNLKELKHEHQYTDEAVLYLRFLWQHQTTSFHFISE